MAVGGGIVDLWWYGYRVAGRCRKASVPYVLVYLPKQGGILVVRNLGREAWGGYSKLSSHNYSNQSI
jgi:hypothetical protein